MILVNDAKVHLFLPNFLTTSSLFTLRVQTTHKISQTLLIKLFVSNIVTDLSCNLSEYYTLYTVLHVWILFEVGCLYQHTKIALYRLNRNEKLLQIFVKPSNNCAFYRPELNLWNCHDESVIKQLWFLSTSLLLNSFSKSNISIINSKMFSPYYIWDMVLKYGFTWWFQNILSNAF